MPIYNDFGHIAIDAARIDETCNAYFKWKDLNTYISNNSQFEEAHTGLEDIDIEIEIFKKSMEMLGNTIVNLNTAPTWRDYSVVVEED